MRALAAILVGLLVVAVVLSDLRFLRVAQREHYLAGEVTRFARRWWWSRWENAALVLAGSVGALAAVVYLPLAFLPLLASGVGPLGLRPRGRTGRLVWTRRLATVAVATAILEAAAFACGAALAGLAGTVAAAALVSMLAPAAVDLALISTRPLEERLARRFVATARERLERVHPIVVAVTGSYGKTTVKGYIAHLIGQFRVTLPSPKSYNNRAGLARTVNEHLGAATEVLVAEMGTYGVGEIAELCAWMRPEISVITAIGPAHLERFRSLETTLRAKSEITATAKVVVLNVDDPRLARLAADLRESGRRVVAASAKDERADVVVCAREEGLELKVGGQRVGVASVASADRPTALSNAAAAAAVALELGVPAQEILARLASLPLPANRLQRYVVEKGYVVYDDTFNSNPTGAKLALERLAAEPAVGEAGRRAVVTPGMVELGEIQRAENASFAEAAARVADVLIVVGRTNRRALREGADRAGGARVLEVDRLDEALSWVRANLDEGDAVLYENDLPDHYP